MRRSTRKQERPAGACASTRNASLIGAEQNHLWPSMIQISPSARAVVSFARTSEPPCRSVIAIPQSASPLVRRGIHSSARSGCARRAGTAANVIETGQPTPASTSPSRMKSAARATCAPRPLVDPRQRLDARVQRQPQERVPGRVELDLVDPLAEAVVRTQHRRMLVREPAPLERLAAEGRPEGGDLRLPGRAALAPQRLDEGRVLLVEVVARERRRLVGSSRSGDRHQAGGTFWLKRSTLPGS